MGTEKRERQKANRAKRRTQDARAERKQQALRNGLQWGAAVVAIVVAVVLIATLTGCADESIVSEGPTAIPGSAPQATQPTTAPSTTAAQSASTVAIAGTQPAASSAPKAGVDGQLGATACPDPAGTPTRVQQFSAPPPMCIDLSKTYTAEIVTNKGALTVELFAQDAPKTVNNFVVLSRYHFYDGLSCHRIISQFMAQCGDPSGNGSGGPGYAIDDELPAEGSYKVGSLAMANAGPNTGGSQFFIITGPEGAALPPSYSLFGQVTKGLDDTVPALDKAAGPRSSDGVPPSEPVTIESVTITES